MLLKLWKLFFDRPRIRALPRHLVRQYDMLDLDWDTMAVLMTARAKDPVEVQKLMKRHDAKSAAELIAKLPPRRRPSFHDKLLNFLQRIEGSSPTPPHRRAKPNRQTTVRGTSTSRLKITYRDD